MNQFSPMAVGRPIIGEFHTGCNKIGGGGKCDFEETFPEALYIFAIIHHPGTHYRGLLDEPSVAAEGPPESSTRVVDHV